jgi:hypothetical protein
MMRYKAESMLNFENEEEKSFVFQIPRIKVDKVSKPITKVERTNIPIATPKYKIIFVAIPFGIECIAVLRISSLFLLIWVAELTGRS